MNLFELVQVSCIKARCIADDSEGWITVRGAASINSFFSQRSDANEINLREISDGFRYLSKTC